MTSTHIWIMCIIFLVLSVVSWWIFDEYGIQYRFLNKILKKRGLYSIIIFLSLSHFSLFVLAWFFPSWWIYILGGIWIGTVGQLPPLVYGIRSVNLLSYEQLYDIYVTKADYWEKNLKKKKEKRMKRKNKRKNKK